MNSLRSIQIETGAEILKALRAPEFILPTLIFPAAFYGLFGIVLSGGATENAAYLLATYGVFAVMGPSIFGFGIAVANERERGWLDLKRAAPAPAVSYILAKVITTLIFASVSVAMVHALAGFVAGVQLPRPTWAALLGVHMLSTLPFILVGLLIGFAFKANGAVAIANLLFMGLAILGGLWIPVFVFPSFMQSLAQFLPSFHLAEIALDISGAPGTRNIQSHLSIIAVMTLALMALTVFVWRHQRT